MFVQADATQLPFADQSFDLVFGSPPYADARTYGIGAQGIGCDVRLSQCQLGRRRCGDVQTELLG